MARLSLNPDPTFIAEVGIPIPGGAPSPVKFTFKHRTSDEVKAWLAETDPDKPNSELVMEMAVGWDLDDEFNPDNVKRLCNAYIGAGMAIYVTYLAELRGVRAKN